MKKQEQLFYLIKSLSNSEKKNIRKNFKKNSNYLKLFDAIDSQSEYNNNEIRGLFKNTKFIKQLHVTKNYLTKQILKNLKNDNSEISVNIKLNNLLSEVEFLFRRELFDQCSFLISKAEQIAYDYEKNKYMGIILDWKLKLFMLQKDVYKNKEQIKDIISSQREFVELAKTENKYWNLTINQFDYFNNPQEEKEKILNNLLLKNIENAKTLRSKIIFYHINYTNAVTSKKPAKALEYLNELLKVIEANPRRIIEDPSSYITTLNNKVSLLLNLKHYNLIPETLNEIRNVPVKYNVFNKEKFSVRIILRTYNIELEMYRDTKDYNKAENLIKQIETFIMDNYKSITNDYKILFYYQFAYIYFMLGKYDQSLSWTNKLFQADFAKIRGDIYTYSRFLNLMIHYELSNNIVLKYAVDATGKYLRKKRKLQAFEKVLLRFFSKISLRGKEEHKKLFAELERNIFAKTEDKIKSNVIDYIDFYSWIESKISKL